MDEELREAVLAAAVRAEVRDAVAAVYASLAKAIEERRPICRTSGRCCRFEEFGHRLYVTTLELAKLVHDLSEMDKPSAATTSPKSLPVLTTNNSQPTTHDPPDGCRFQIEGLCTIHAIRPFGCRVFFCDATSTQWQQDQYEKHHARLRQLHEELGVPYRYVEWRYALVQLGLAAGRDA
ncbi:MAG TPA: hypothetical protein VH370_08250 [Humisphaera sp.]|jgi:Fe-S-cluster containining protein|nr:hypothetical protein [Humisphaera sp.]